MILFYFQPIFRVVFVIFTKNPRRCTHCGAVYYNTHPSGVYVCSSPVRLVCSIYLYTSAVGTSNIYSMYKYLIKYRADVHGAHAEGLSPTRERGVLRYIMRTHEYFLFYFKRVGGINVTKYTLSHENRISTITHKHCR